MVKIYGCSDDLIEIDGTKEEELEVWGHDAVIYLTDGTILCMGYRDNGIWRINVHAKGSLPQTLTICNGVDPDKDYSDVFESEADFKRWSRITTHIE